MFPGILPPGWRRPGDEAFMPFRERACGSKYFSREEMPMQANKNNWRQQGGRFAVVDELAPIRFLSREEFELLKQRNPNLMEMKAGDIIYLTEIPQER